MVKLAKWTCVLALFASVICAKTAMCQSSILEESTSSIGLADTPAPNDSTSSIGLDDTPAPNESTSSIGIADTTTTDTTAAAEELYTALTALPPGSCLSLVCPSPTAGSYSDVPISDCSVEVTTELPTTEDTNSLEPALEGGEVPQQEAGFSVLAGELSDNLPETGAANYGAPKQPCDQLSEKACKDEKNKEHCKFHELMEWKDAICKDEKGESKPGKQRMFAKCCPAKQHCCAEFADPGRMPKVECSKNKCGGDPNIIQPGNWVPCSTVFHGNGP